MNRYFLTSGVQGAKPPGLIFGGMCGIVFRLIPKIANTCVTATSTQNRHRIFLTFQGLTGLFFLTFLPKEV